jgi:hypothetical protein
MADPEHIIWTAGYQSPQLLQYVALSLMFFGKTEVLRATIFKRLGEVEEVYRLHDPSYMDATKQKLLMDLMKDQLVDDFRIITYFENVLKAKLLLERVIIHRFQIANGDVERFKQADKAQKKIPMSASNIVPSGITDADLSKRTIGMDLLLSPPYQKVIALSEDVLRVVKEINERRNKLHFNSFAEFGMGPSVLKDYRLLLDHVHETERFLSSQRFKYDPEFRKC